MTRPVHASLSLLIVIVLMAQLSSIAAADWVGNGNLLSDRGGSYAAIAPDGAGGAIVVWEQGDILAQRISASGDTLWTGSGVTICAASGSQLYPCIVSDGAGGAIVAWEDRRDGVSDQNIYAQRVDASGSLLWGSGDVAICTTGNTQSRPVIVSDGSGGAIIVWDSVGDPTGKDLYAQRVDPSGNVLWTVNGVPVCTASRFQEYHSCVSDGAGGVIVAWVDQRSETQSEAYAQRVDASGVAQWTVNGVDLCTGTGHEDYVVVASDGTGGAIVAWSDYRSGLDDIYAQRVSALGVVEWAADGLPICTQSDVQDRTAIVSDGAGGAIVAWNDTRPWGGYAFAQRVNASGVVQWTADGVSLPTGFGTHPVIVSDGAGGAIVALGYADVFAQRVDASGVIQWGEEGIEICTAPDYQWYPAITTDGSGGAIVAWDDFRTGFPADYSYAQRVTHQGNIGSDPTVPVSGPAVLGGAAALGLFALRTLRRKRAEPN